MYVLPEERYIIINEFLRGGYEPLDEEFPVTDSDWKWLVTHTEYTEQELGDMLHGGCVIMLNIRVNIFIQDSEWNIRGAEYTDTSWSR